MIKKTQQIMGMPITIMINDDIDPRRLDVIFDFFRYVDETYSPFKETSIVSAINKGEIVPADYSQELRDILALAELTTKETDGYFALWYRGIFDPSGIVKGWAIQKASAMLDRLTSSYYIEAGGDIQVSGHGSSGDGWKVGVRNPFDRTENVSIVILHNEAIATSGTAVRGQHIYNPLNPAPITDVVSLSVIAPRIIDADRIATAAFAMSKKGIYFLENQETYEGFMIDAARQATRTTGWESYERNFA